MPKNTRRVTVQRTVTFTTTIDTPGYPEETDANMLVALGGAAGNTGTLSIGELLAGSNLSNNGTISKGNWAVTGTSTNVEPYITRPQNAALALGQRVASVKPVAGNEAALSKLFVVTAINTGTNGGRTADQSTEQTWTLTDGNTTTDGGVTFRTIPKFPTISNWDTAAKTLGTVWRPRAGSMLEYLITTAGTPTAAATTFDTSANYALGAAISAGTLGGTTTAICIAGALTYAFQTQYALGDVVKPSSGSTEEYLVTVAGKSNVSALSATVNNSVTLGTATFKRIV